MTRSDRWKKRKCVVEYYKFKDELNAQAKRLGYVPEVPLSIHFVIPMPKSWSKKKKREMLGKGHESTPDLDNLIKAFKDCLLKEDSWVSRYGEMSKTWGEEGEIRVVHNG